LLLLVRVPPALDEPLPPSWPCRLPPPGTSSKQPIAHLDNATAGAIVARERVAPRAVLTTEPGQERTIRAAPSVDALVFINDRHHSGTSRWREQLDELVLGGIDVVEFVHEEPGVVAAPYRR